MRDSFHRTLRRRRTGAGACHRHPVGDRARLKRALRPTEQELPLRPERNGPMGPAFDVLLQLRHRGPAS
jgi:hypothetical protein